jgi:hypothetical protein
MQIISNLLPGLRDLRAPLAAGYLWVVGLWLLLVDIVPPHGSATGVLAHIYALANYLGQGTVLAAVSFTAYLIGSVLSVDADGPIATRSAKVAKNVRLRTPRLLRPDGSRRFTARPSPSKDPLVTRFNDRLSERVIWDTQNYIRRLRKDLLPLSAPSSMSAQPDDDAPLKEWNEDLEHWVDSVWEFQVFQMLANLIAETRQLVTRLRVTSPPLFDQYDRARGEAEFRLSVSFPIAFIIGVLAWKWTLLWLLAFPAVILIMNSGIGRAREATDVLAEAALTGYVTPTAWPDQQANKPLAIAMDALDYAKDQSYVMQNGVYVFDNKDTDKIKAVLAIVKAQQEVHPPSPQNRLSPSSDAKETEVRDYSRT